MMSVGWVISARRSRTSLPAMIIVSSGRSGVSPYDASSASGSAMSPPMESMTSMPPASISSTAAAISSGTADRRVDQHDAGQLGVALGQRGGERAAHREPRHDDLAVGHSGLQRGEGAVGLGEPVVPAGLDHVLDRGAVARAGEAARPRSPASANTSASGRIDTGLPVNPCSTSTPCGPPPGDDHGSHPGRIGWTSSAGVRTMAGNLPAGPTGTDRRLAGSCHQSSGLGVQSGSG